MCFEKIGTSKKTVVYNIEKSPYYEDMKEFQHEHSTKHNKSNTNYKDKQLSSMLQ